MLTSTAIKTSTDKDTARNQALQAISSIAQVSTLQAVNRDPGEIISTEAEVSYYIHLLTLLRI